ncbi:receptor-type tyrosine-protein phosphatase F-like isoform X2 [Dermacentor albipictus]|uniref:receptor-type tyrosine-protein phosphatase F-like isoform X2 n=1 Tax=Dermacentor albipictus TaxID=60249 RepID=UPI0038FC0261
MLTHSVVLLLAALTFFDNERKITCAESYSKEGGTIVFYSPAGPKAKGNENANRQRDDTPAAPTNVRASPTCDSHVDVTWSYSDESATSFWLEMCMPGITTCQTANVGKDTRAFTFHVGSTENTYELSIWASRGVSTQAVNSTRVAVNVTTFPYVPLMDSVTVSAATASTLRISWTAEWKYKLRISVCPFEGLKKRCNENLVDGLAHVYTISGLNASTLYEVDTTAQVTRYGMTCTGPVFEQDVTTFSSAAPRDVTLVNATKTSLTYSWLADPSARKCRIQVKAMSPNFTAAHTTGWLPEVADSTFIERTVFRLSPGTLYETSIQNCADYCGLPTVIRSLTDVDAPSTVWQLQSNLKGFSDVVLTWARPQKPNGPIDGYTIELCNKDSNKTHIQTVDRQSLFLSVHLHDHFTHYKASVSAYNIDHAHNMTLLGAADSIDFISLGEGPFPPLPKVATVEERQASLSWKTPHDPRYNITQFCVCAMGTACSFTSDNRYALYELLPYQKYTVNVSSCNSVKCGEARSVDFVTDVGVPSLPRTLTIESLGTSSIEMKWQNPETPSGPISGYIITCSHGEQDITATTNDTMFNVTSLKPGSLYSISVYAFNDGRLRRKRGPASLLNVSTDSERIPLEGTSTSTIATVVTTLFVVTLVASVYIAFQKRRQRKLARSVEEFDCHSLVSEETSLSPRKYISNCFSSSL